MMGFPHANMHPAGGNEVAVVSHVGGGVAREEDTFGTFHGGGMLSYAHDFGRMAISVAGGAFFNVESINYHFHTEFARPVSASPVDVLFGVGYSGTYEMNIPQLSFGVLRGAPLTSGGHFGGFRISTGPIFDPTPSGELIAFSGSLGYQWWAKRVAGFSLQAAPYLCVHASRETTVSVGAMIMLSLTFGER